MDSNPDAGTTMITSQIDLSSISIGEMGNTVAEKYQTAGRYNEERDTWEDWTEHELDKNKLGIGGKAGAA